jgi:hypothetical protein
MAAKRSCGAIYRWAIPIILALIVCAASLLTACGLTGGGAEPTAVLKSLPADWDRYFNEDYGKPRSDQEINGILVGPTAREPDYNGLCAGPDVDSRYLPAGSVVGGDLDFDPGYLPEGVQPVPSPAAVAVRTCSGTIVTVLKEYDVSPKYSDQHEGVLLWSGGGFSIMRERSSIRAFPLFGAAERMGPITVAGRPAVLMRPVMPAGVDIGMGDMAIVIAEDFGLTAIQGGGLPVDEFIKIAEGLY